MSHDTDVVKDAIRITTILSRHLTARQCYHCKELFKDVIEWDSPRVDKTPAPIGKAISGVNRKS